MRFHIVEGEDNSSLDKIYNNFKEDFLNPTVTIDDLRSKFDLSHRMYNVLRSRVLKETGLKRKPQKRPNSKVIGKHTYIQSNNGTYRIVKYIDGCLQNFGNYKDLETAIKVRDKLIACDWDKTKL